ncbi:alpha/beta fold hydrolase [Streptomyces sp. 5-8]|uniref:Alpha/beta fold hydrolase n=1 Tax=Streptomyces musisoli TaxID=2802280 RepID=A0ABS1PB26_9ACTN|nr:alpha/beta fold hydrolase [Streptomyces musisoli]MBL1109592.1 alpha/beta fold hydrolase [Streptomyces musisoli]
MAPHTVVVSDRPMPEDAGAAHRRVGIRGTELHLAEYGGTGTPLLMLHGFPQHWYAWHKVARQLSGEYRLLCPDLRGFGWSGATRRGYDMDGLADDVLALLDALGIGGPVGLVGHDWGAFLGFRLCLRAPERFTGYVALNMSHHWPRHRAVLPNLWRLWYTAFVEYPVLGRAVLRHWPGFTRFLLRHQVADPAVWTKAEIDEYASATSASAAAGQAMFWQYVLRDIPGLFRGTWRRHRLTVPTLLLGGERDSVIAPSLLAGAERYADELSVRLVPGAGHHLPQERPEAVAEAIREHFAEEV